MERFVFVKIGELCGEYSFDVFWFMSKYNMLYENVVGDGWVSRSLEDYILLEFKICVGYGVLNIVYNKIEVCLDLVKMIIDVVYVVCVLLSGSLW